MSRYLVNLKKGNDYLVPKVFGGIDTTNVIASTNTPYTATQDCIVIPGRYNTGFTIDGVRVCYGAMTDNFFQTMMFVKQGQVVKKESTSDSASITAYAIKY